MAVTGGGGGLVAGCRSPFGKAGHRWEGCVPGRKGRAKSVGIGGTGLPPSCRIRHKKENVQRRSFFVRSGRGQHSFPGEAPAVAAACDFWRCAALFPAVRQRRGPLIPTREKFFQGGGRAREGGGTVFTKNVPPPSRLSCQSKPDVTSCCRAASGGDQPSGQGQVFSGWGRAREGEGQFLQKTSLPPLVQKSVAETIRRRRRSRRRRRDWRRFRPGGPDGRPPACADGCPGDGCIRSRRCAPDGGRR